MAILQNAALDAFPFFEMTPDLVCIATKEGFFQKVNPAVIAKFEYTEEELFAKPIADLIHPDDKDLTRRERTELLNGKPLMNFQNRYITKTGKILWLDWTSVYFPEQEVVFAIAKDITARKLIEIEVGEEYKKFKNLASHFKSRIEKDRRYFAMELHEEVAQLASAVKMDIDWIKLHIPDRKEPLKTRTEHVLAISDLLIDKIRRISFSISPYMLNDLGLHATLKWLCKEFTILNKIPCLYEGSFDEAKITNEIQLDFFRICQEALANVIHYAQAHSVKISIKETGDHICLSITDDGKGFDVEEQKQNPGLTSIRDQAASINSILSIQTEPGKGTTISVTVKV